MPKAGDRAELFLDPLNDAMHWYDINTPLRQAAFLAQIAHESGSLKYVSEIASGKAYNHRSDLGNTLDAAIKTAYPFDPGPFYKGRGLIQITGYFNYKNCADALGVDLLHYPSMLEAPDLAARSAAWFWSAHGLNELADKQWFKTITRRINGGLNGYQDRLHFYIKAKEVIHA